MRVGCYLLHLYCDNCTDGTRRTDAEYTAQNRSSVYRQARKDGWILGKERDLCPKCSGKKPVAKKKTGEAVTIYDAMRKADKGKEE